jgi:hypothetical protein
MKEQQEKMEAEQKKLMAEAIQDQKFQSRFSGTSLGSLLGQSALF